MSNNPSKSDRRKNKENYPKIENKVEEANIDNFYCEHQIEPLNLSIRQNIPDGESKTYEENGKIHRFREVTFKTSEIWYCIDCDRLVIEGSVYQRANTKPKSKDRSARFRFADNQMEVLKFEFEKQDTIDRQHRLKLSQQLQIPERQIMMWWQNERARRKKKRN